MTALNYTLEPELVVICADTLRTNPSKQPNGLASKVLPLPHLHGVVCGRGSLDLLLSWYVFIQTEVIAMDMRQLDQVTTGPLRKLWLDHCGDGPATSSIFHFGLDSSDGRLRGWRYSSETEFVSEALADKTFRVMPAIDPLIQLWIEADKTSDRIHTFIELMQAQQQWDR